MTCIVTPAHVVNAKINGRTLSRALRETKARNRFGKIEPTKWIDICPTCDLYVLGCDMTTKSPFLCGDNVMRTIEDFDLPSESFNDSLLEFCGLKFSRSALINAGRIARNEFSGISKLEDLGSRTGANSSPDELIDFSRQVCVWGGGERVWGNLFRFHEIDELAKLYLHWFTVASNASDPEEAIRHGIAIKGLGISFASKHLRLLRSRDFAVLDEVISVGLGFALNVKGYGLFMRALRQFIAENRLTLSVSELEASIFVLVRQKVRSDTKMADA